mmetsp:Transcript_12207/g.25755  ORF Transcript_12207/g.25755 Transcript_12207/m.25755 type:complete len:405 (-) Transcript_12207:113-1327(-)
MAAPRALASPTASVIINACAIFFLAANLIQNYLSLHDRAVNETGNANAGVIGGNAPHLPSESSSSSSLTVSPDRGSIGDNENLHDMSEIGMKIPRGKAVALPSVRISDEEESSIRREFYGGKGDKPHLGGFTEFDVLGVSPSLWKHMISKFGIKSVLDVGCGRGIATAWFVAHELDYVHCVEGSHDAVEQSIIPREIVTEHDFSRGPWWPERTVDALWCVEFTEHVGRNYQPNYLTAFRKAALIFVTHSNWGGWHHVEVHDDDWWKTRFEAAGLVYSNSLTQEVRSVAQRDQGLKNLTLDMKPDHLYYVGQHIYLNMQVFINPMVASLPQHAHLFSEHGCFGGRDNNGNKIHIDCHDAIKKDNKLSTLPEEFKPLKLTAEMDKKWFDLVKGFKTNGRKMKGIGT